MPLRFLPTWRLSLACHMAVRWVVVPCAGNETATCLCCSSDGTTCTKCNTGFYRKSSDGKCASCTSLANCQTCGPNGCNKCNTGTPLAICDAPQISCSAIRHSAAGTAAGPPALPLP